MRKFVLAIVAIVVLLALTVVGVVSYSRGFDKGVGEAALSDDEFARSVREGRTVTCGTNALLAIGVLRQGETAFALTPEALEILRTPPEACEGLVDQWAIDALDHAAEIIQSNDTP